MVRAGQYSKSSSRSKDLAASYRAATLKSGSS